MDSGGEASALGSDVGKKDEKKKKKKGFHIGPDLLKFWGHKIVNIFLSISLNICFGCSAEPSHRDSSFDYPQHMFWLKNNFYCQFIS